MSLGRCEALTLRRGEQCKMNAIHRWRGRKTCGWHFPYHRWPEHWGPKLKFVTKVKVDS